jgi:hypothetical protein
MQEAKPELVDYDTRNPLHKERFGELILVALIDRAREESAQAIHRLQYEV